MENPTDPGATAELQGIDGSGAGVMIELELDRRINFAMQQNDVPVVKLLRVANRGDTVLRDLKVEVQSDPEFAGGWTGQISEIAPGATYNLPPVDLQLSYGPDGRCWCTRRFARTRSISPAPGHEG